MNVIPNNSYLYTYQKQDYDYCYRKNFALYHVHSRNENVTTQTSNFNFDEILDRGYSNDLQITLKDVLKICQDPIKVSV